jgi:hypothetical protein
MNNKAQIGFVFIVTALIFILALFGLIDPFKESLDTVRGGTNLNCHGTPTFNQTTFDNQTSSDQLIRRPTCFLTGISFFWFMSVFIFAVGIWVVKNWRRFKGK